MKSPIPPALKTAIFRTFCTSLEPGSIRTVDDLRHRDLVEELGAVAEAEAARLTWLRGPARSAAEDRVDLDRPDRELPPGPLGVLRVRREHRGREPVSCVVGLLERLVERTYDLDGGDGAKGLLVHEGHSRTHPL